MLRASDQPMTYEYHFDRTSIGDLHLRRAEYEMLHRAYELLRDELERWNQNVAEEGYAHEPYSQEVSDLNGRIKWGEAEMRDNPWEIVVRGISIGSLRYAVAALLFDIHQRSCDHHVKRDQGWPSAALRTMRDTIQQTQGLADKLGQEPSEVLWEVMPRNETPTRTGAAEPRYDAFISHASEDKGEFVRPLATALQEAGVSVWFDEFSLAVGDSLRRSIDRGLADSRFGIVVLSPRFLKKEWPQKELDGLVAREVDGTKVVLPVWLDLKADQVRRYSPVLADRVAAKAEDGISQVVAELSNAIGRPPSADLLP